MPELFWIIVGYTAILTLCFLLGEYLQNRRAAKKSHTRPKENTPLFPDSATPNHGPAAEHSIPKGPASRP